MKIFKRIMSFFTPSTREEPPISDEMRELYESAVTKVASKFGSEFMTKFEAAQNELVAKGWKKVPTSIGSGNYDKPVQALIKEKNKGYLLSILYVVHAERRIDAKLFEGELITQGPVDEEDRSLEGTVGVFMHDLGDSKYTVGRAIYVKEDYIHTVVKI